MAVSEPCRPKRRLSFLVRAIASLLPICLAANGATAQTEPHWPQRSVTMIVPYAPGGNTDVQARIVGQYLSEKLGQSFIIDNRGGGNGVAGTAAVATAKPDGYTLFFGSPTQLVVMPMVQKVPYDALRDFAPVSILAAGSYILGIQASLPPKTLVDFIAYAKANPGKLNYGIAGRGGSIHLATALLSAVAGLDMTGVPYKGGGPAMAGFLQGETEVYFGNGSELLAQVDSGRIRILATSAPERLPDLPDLPAVSELFPGFRVMSWNGLLAPKETPRAIIDILAKQMAAMIQDPAVLARLKGMGVAPIGNTPAEFSETIKSENQNFAIAVKAAGLTQE